MLLLAGLSGLFCQHLFCHVPLLLWSHGCVKRRGACVFLFLGNLGALISCQMLVSQQEAYNIITTRERQEFEAVRIVSFNDQ